MGASSHISRRTWWHRQEQPSPVITVKTTSVWKLDQSMIMHHLFLSCCLQGRSVTNCVDADVHWGRACQLSPARVRAKPHVMDRLQIVPALEHKMEMLGYSPFVSMFICGDRLPLIESKPFTLIYVLWISIAGSFMKRCIYLPLLGHHWSPNIFIR